MFDLPILSILTFLPLFGAACIFFLARGEREDVARTSRWMALVDFGCSVLGIPPNLVRL